MLFIAHENELIFNTKIQALYFYASWMPYHNKMMIMIDKVKEKYKDISFFAIDSDHFKILCHRFNVESIPDIVIFNGGKEIKRINGLVMTSAFRSIFADIYNNSIISGEIK